MHQKFNYYYIYHLKTILKLSHEDQALTNTLIARVKINVRASKCLSLEYLRKKKDFYIYHHGEASNDDINANIPIFIL